ncbi:50S ribosomal protein L1 [Candidatus Woesearchaeota archaeon]|nr:50S ribosomal protein L1 [Candidatus Woesearchaeota archaeon]
MDKKSFLEALQKVKGYKRNFSQSYELVINLKDIDLKKTDNQIDLFIQLPNGRGKKISVCAFVDPQLLDEAKAACDEVILQDNFSEYGKNKKAAKKLARKHDFFIAQSNIMPQVATFFGRALGPKGKMPNPKAGCIVPQKTNLRQLRENLQRTVRVSAKTAPILQCIVGIEGMDVEKVAENAVHVYEQVIHKLPNEEQNVKSLLVKLTMSPPVAVK